MGSVLTNEKQEMGGSWADTFSFLPLFYGLFGVMVFQHSLSEQTYLLRTLPWFFDAGRKALTCLITQHLALHLILAYPMSPFTLLLLSQSDLIFASDSVS